MQVSVTSDSTPANNKVYILANVAMGGTDNSVSNNSNWIDYSSYIGAGSPFEYGTNNAIQPVIGGNVASGCQSTIGGGCNNSASGACSTIGGGFGNNASNFNSNVGGGTGNEASGGFATIGGGINNKAKFLGATVGGGYGNYVQGKSSFIGGGYYNVILGC